VTQVPFNQAGVDAKRQELSLLAPVEFEEQMNLIQHSTRVWYIDNFILNSDQIDYVNAVPQLLIDYIGIHSRIAFEADEPFVLEVPDVYYPPLSAAKPRKTKPYAKGGGTWTPGTGKAKWKLEFGLKFTIPL
jgi:hypothetical protein|tara:strand:- start:1492 stop:1887 length:396 start_codon:yes stop_codon:yes gene_type:complete